MGGGFYSAVKSEHFDAGHFAPGLIFFLVGVFQFVHFCILVAVDDGPQQKGRHGQAPVFNYIMRSDRILLHPFKTTLLAALIVCVAVLLSFAQLGSLGGSGKNLQHVFMYMGWGIVALVDILERKQLAPAGATGVAYIMGSANVALLFSGHPPHSHIELILHDYLINLFWILTLCFVAHSIVPRPQRWLKGSVGFFFTMVGMVFFHASYLKNIISSIDEEHEMMAVMNIRMVYSSYLMFVFCVYGISYLVAYNYKKRPSRLSVDEQEQYNQLGVSESNGFLEEGVELKFK
mmetsp:Transcript_31160/g.38489  ORF Transcript_31160/g.38489 Transcript_31160/m.38489 type:complete len:290 (+) Transcript_31160:271-1140(+)|eukprot:CAMPEP_0204828928 /NCGR_PEP_ID=MMETSP1346-20131115/6898_1 /ASSEMBLY_ACC=CAM_ASM_000771 /TAXON_ID=215587 /ORGANISM="Aplanochytrium stocchinoi, Strain GSBS06" /LENGTH=289 /DNA_ID=CAMNT_0051958345 /DNA_START=155 /DNA_END=1024 /DNA_ORIENTATION=+